MDKEELLTNLSSDYFQKLFTDGQAFSSEKEELLFHNEVLKGIPAFVHIRDQKTGKIIWWNEEWKRKMLRSEKKVPPDIEHFLSQFIHPDDLFLLKRSNEHYQHKNVPKFGGLIRIRFPEQDGWSWLFGVSRIIRKNKEGIPLHTLAVFLDITQDLHTESQTREALHEVLRRSNFEILEKITEREKQVIRLLVRGYNNNEIAKYLYISHHTVESHRKNIRMKLNVKNTLELISLAKDLGI